MGARSGRIIYAGTYERDYPRNALTIEALRRAGYAVREIHEPIWERSRDKTGRFLSPLSLARLAFRLGWTYAKLATRLAPVLPRCDAVVFGYIGQADMLVLAPLVRLLRRPVIFNPLVTLTDTLVEDRALVPAGSLLARIVALLDHWSLRLADLVIVDTPENGAYLTERFGIPSDRTRELDVGADESLFRPAGPADRRGRDGLRVLFYGKFTPLHGIETILRAAKLLEHSPDIRFEVVGDGQLAGEMRALAADLGLSNAGFVRWVPFAELPARIAAADVVLGIFGDTAKAARVVPNKVFQAMAMGAPLVTRDSPAIRRVLRNDASALLVPPADPAALAEAILRLRDPDLRGTLGAGARAAFLLYGSRDALADRAGAIVASLLSLRGEAAARLERG